MTIRNGLMSSSDKKKLDEYSAVSNESGKFMGADGKWATPKDDDSWASEKLTIGRGMEVIELKRSSGAVECSIPSATVSLAGLMSSGDKVKLDGISAGAQVNSVTGVKGSAETNYRTGNVNITAANVGAAVSDHSHSGYALSTHNHDSAYAAASHTHSGYAASNHTHSEYASSSHNHDSVYAAKSHSHSEYASSSHNHDSVYAAKSHGNHVPTTQTANNAKFLRCDNSWQTVTPANIGAAATSHTHSAANITSATTLSSVMMESPWNYYYESGTAAGTAIKVATQNSGNSTAFTDQSGCLVLYLQYNNTAESPQLNINGVGAKPLRCYNASGTIGSPPAGALVKGWYLLYYNQKYFYILTAPLGFYKAMLA